MKFRISAFELFHYIDKININNGIFGLDFNLLIIYNFDIIIIYGDFFYQLEERLHVSSNKDDWGFNCSFTFSLLFILSSTFSSPTKLLDIATRA